MNSFEIQSITEGLQIDKAGLNTNTYQKWIKQKILSEKWHDSGLQASIKHFVCTRLDEMELVRNLGHMS